MQYLKLQLLLLIAVVEANSDYYQVGTGIGQFGLPSRLKYVHFNNFCEESMVRKISIEGRFVDKERLNGDFYFSLRLENKEEEARTVGWNMMSFASYIYTSFTGHENKKNRGYLYQMSGNTNSPPKTKPTSGFITNTMKFEYKRFQLDIYVEPSHYLFVLMYDGEEKPAPHNVMQNYYGYFHEMDDAEKHYNEFDDSIFNSIHIEGDVEIDQFSVESGGPFRRPNGIPMNQEPIRFSPYLRKKFIELAPQYGQSATYPELQEQKYLFVSPQGDTYMEKEEEWEIIIRGRVGGGDFFAFTFEDVANNGDRLASPSTLGDFVEIKSMMEDKARVEPEMKSYYEKYSENPFKKDMDFEMSVRRLSYSDKNSLAVNRYKWGYDDYNGYPRFTVQVTVRVLCRTWTWYFEVHNYYQMDAVKIAGDVTIHQLALIS